MNNLIGNKAIDFTAKLVDANNQIKIIELKKYLSGGFGVLFFYPLDFTFVCPTEILSLNSKLPEFLSRNAKILAISIDSVYTHLAWKSSDYANGGVGSIKIPLISDINKEIINHYGTLNVKEGISFRSTVIIDSDFNVIYQSIYSDFMGRNINEYLRILDAAIVNKETGFVCPADWQKNSQAIKPDIQDVSSYIIKLYK